MQWLEIMGPHGIGKTTLRKHVRLYTRQPKHPVRNTDLVSLVDGWNFNRPTTWDALSDWHGFLKSVERLYKGGNSRPDTKRRRNFCKAMMRMHIISKSEFAGAEVWDLIGSEGMILSYTLKNFDNIRWYFETMPISLGVVILEADPEVIIERNKNRDPKIDFGELADSGIRACSLAASLLAKRTRVLRLDAMQHIEDNVKAIAEFAVFEKGVVSSATSVGDLPT